MGDSAGRISDLYHRALERLPEERGAFLREACGGDEDLRRDVESLLHYETESDGFLERPAAMPAEVLAGAVHAARAVPGHIGPYTILGPLGAGGMGEVYRARDTKLVRDVALKLLPPHLTADPERRARLAREARLLATLNHPNVASIYGLEDANGVTALVLELVNGPSLADRLARGPLPVPQALALARQLADALDAAHEKGIVHRDLKPANIVLQAAPGSDEIRAKVLDFGLAKLMPPAGAGGPRDGDAGSLAPTADGRILGTPAYMSPEQARGQPVDRRTDIWAFGCVLYEMLTGRRAFDGDTMTDTFARVLEHEPDWGALPPHTPAAVRTLARRCLRKDPAKRLHDIGDARIELEELGDPDLRVVADAAPAPTLRLRRLPWALSAGAVTLAVVISWLYLRALPPPGPAVEFPVTPPEPWFSANEPSTPAFEVSPDGQYLAATALSEGVSMVWVRPIAGPPWRLLAGTEGAVAPFWSPNSDAIGFFANGQLKTVRLDAGSPVVLADPVAGLLPGGAWSRDGTILFSSRGGVPLQKIPAGGGVPVAVTTLTEGEIGHRWPSFLPDGDRYLFISMTESSSELRIGTLSSGETATLGPAESQAIYASGHLLFVRSNSLMAQPFDLRAQRLVDEPVILAPHAPVILPWHRGLFSASGDGVLVYSSVGRPMSQLTWIDRSGTPEGTVGEPGYYFHLDLSPDDRRIAVSRHVEGPGVPRNVDIWLIELDRGAAMNRLTVHPGREFDPVWSPDGETLAFNSSRSGTFSLYSRSASGAGDDLLLKASRLAFAPHWSPDGTAILYTEDGDQTRNDLWTLPLGPGATPAVFLRTPFNERAGVFSPDGRWVAYESDETGRWEIHVRAFPPAEGRYVVSSEGGRAARWRGDGRELYFLAPDGTMMAVGVETRGGFRVSTPTTLFKTDLGGQNTHPYAVRRDGQRFLLPIRRDSADRAPLTIVLNWPARLRQ